MTEDEIKKWESEGVVKFLGQVSNVKSYLSNISVFVLPSYREGVPRSTQEAMAIGLPIITTNVPGCRDTIINMVNGIMIPPFDIQSLADAMVFFIQNPQSITIMGRESRIIAEKKFNEIEAAN
ncbi:glycosyltransferase, partial [Escherichia coli]|nr:glycosyltransferase [Escherichia coli]